MLVLCRFELCLDFSLLPDYIHQTSNISVYIHLSTNYIYE